MAMKVVYTMFDGEVVSENAENRPGLLALLKFVLEVADVFH